MMNPMKRKIEDADAPVQQPFPIRKRQRVTFSIADVVACQKIPDVSFQAQAPAPANGCAPNARLVRAVKQLLTSGRSQKKIARDMGLSATKLSNYLNGAERVKGWGATEEKLVEWLNKLHNKGDLEGLYSDNPATIYELPTIYPTELCLQNLSQQSVIPDVPLETIVNNEPEQYSHSEHEISEAEPSSRSGYEAEAYLSSPQYENSTYEVVSSPEYIFFSNSESDNNWMEAANWSVFNYEQPF